jgi:hypothetical protein
MNPLPYKISNSSQAPCTWKIKSIDKFGLVTIKFGQAMNNSINITTIN